MPLDLFSPPPLPASAPCDAVMETSLDVVRRHRDAGTLYDENGKISADGARTTWPTAGYWGLLIDPQYGGQGAPFAALRAVPDADGHASTPTVAGLASVHGCIGAVDPVRTFGTPEQKQRFLPRLASGERLSGFALTEPGAGSDLTALRTTAVLDGDDYVVNGEKLFITNAVPGRTVGLVCLIDGKPAVLIVDLPDHGERALPDRPLRPVRPASTRTTTACGSTTSACPRRTCSSRRSGDGLTIAYHGLNLGRRRAVRRRPPAAMRVMLANMLPWAEFRRTYGAADRHARAGQAPHRPAGRPDRRLRRPGGLVLVAASTRAIAARWSASSPRSSAARRRRKRPSSCS